MPSRGMKYFIGTAVISCLFVNKAEVISVSPSKSQVVAPFVSATVAAPSLVQNFIQNSASTHSAIKAPAIPADITNGKEGISEEQESSQKKLPGDDTEELNDTSSSDLDMADAFADAGLTYDKDIDLPVFSQRGSLEGQKLYSVPRVTSCRSDGQIAIIYSDGPSNITTDIAHRLDNTQTRANFFVNTLMLNDQQYGIVLQHIYNAGHLIGMTYQILADDLSTMSDEDIKEDIIDSAYKIESLIQVAPKYVRLHSSIQDVERIENILHDLGFVLVGYNLVAKDDMQKIPQSVAQEYHHTFEQYRQANGQKKGSFISIQYDIPETSSLESVPYIVKLVQDEGYTAVRMDGCLNDREPYKSSPADVDYTGDKFSYGTPGYKSGQHIAASIVRNNIPKGEIRGFAADDAFWTASSGEMPAVLFSRLGYIVMPALVLFIII